MNALDSPLEVFLAADSLLTIVNNLWTWLAVIAAASLSLWRITSSSPPPPSELVAPLITPPAEPPAKSVESPPRTAARAFNSEGRTSGKFAVYYNADEAAENNADVGGGGDMDEEPAVTNEWEVSMKMTMWDDMGFRRYQDLTVLDGNVVRLWDGCSRRRNVMNAVVGGGVGYEYNWSS